MSGSIFKIPGFAFPSVSFFVSKKLKKFRRNHDEIVTRVNPIFLKIMRKEHGWQIHHENGRQRYEELHKDPILTEGNKDRIAYMNVDDPRSINHIFNDGCGFINRLHNYGPISFVVLELGTSAKV